jgi:hypothetical protein
MAIFYIDNDSWTVFNFWKADGLQWTLFKDFNGREIEIINETVKKNRNTD